MVAMPGSESRTAIDAPLRYGIMVALILVGEAERRPWLIMFIGLPVGMAVMTKTWVFGGGDSTIVVPEQIYGLRVSFPWWAGASHSHAPYIRVKTAIVY
jgi:hypothetical protein